MVLTIQPELIKSLTEFQQSIGAQDISIATRAIQLHFILEEAIAETGLKLNDQQTPQLILWPPTDNPLPSPVCTKIDVCNIAGGFLLEYAEKSPQTTIENRQGKYLKYLGTPDEIFALIGVGVEVSSFLKRTKVERTEQDLSLRNPKEFDRTETGRFMLQQQIEYAKEHSFSNKCLRVLQRRYDATTTEIEI